MGEVLSLPLPGLLEGASILIQYDRRAISSESSRLLPVATHTFLTGALKVLETPRILSSQTSAVRARARAALLSSTLMLSRNSQASGLRSADVIALRISLSSSTAPRAPG